MSEAFGGAPDGPFRPTKSREQPLIAKYAAALSGLSMDLNDLRKWFTDGLIQVAEIEVPSGWVTALLAREFDDLHTGEAVQARAWELIEQMNGILFASDPDRSRVRVIAVYERGDDGVWGGGAAYGTGKAIVRARVRAEAFVVGPDGLPILAPAPRQPRWLAIASGGPNSGRISNVLAALGGDLEWRDLWKAFEIIDEDWKNRPNWNEGEVVWFRKTATLHRHSLSHKQGVTAQNWLDQNGKPQMELDVARRLLATLAADWLAWQADGACPATLATRWQT